MKIYIMRHGQASLQANTDEERQLTVTGRDDSARMAQWLSKFEPSLDCVLFSPYVRAAQTWDVICNFFDTKTVEVCKDVTPYGDAEHMADFLLALSEQHDYDTMLIVSHLPVVSYLVAALTTDRQLPSFSTSAIACVEVKAQTIELSWIENPVSIN